MWLDILGIPSPGLKRGELPSRGRNTVASPLGLGVHVWAQTNKGSTIGADVILVGAELAALGSHTLELFLSRSIGVTNVHQHALVSDANAIELADDFIANSTALKS